MEDKYFDIAELVGKYLTDDLSDGERVRLAEWVESSEVNRVWFYEVTEPDFVGLKRRHLKAIDVGGGWISLLKKKRRVYRRRLVVQCLKYAGVAIFPLLFAVYFFRGDNCRFPEKVQVVQEIVPGKCKAVLQLADSSLIELNTRLKEVMKERDGTLIDVRGESMAYRAADSLSAQESLYNNLVVPRGGEYRLILSDGTAVHLNADSRLRFPVRFAKHGARRVELEGEGYFRVAEKGGTSPFIVEAGGMEVRVLGTEFNVSAYKADGEVRTTLVNGRVSISSGRSREVCTLLSGNQCIFNKKDGKIKVGQVDVSCVIAWKEGRLRFRNRPLREIMDVVARWYDVEIIYEDGEVGECLFGCNFNRYETVLPLLDVFQSTGTVRFRVEGKRIFVSK